MSLVRPSVFCALFLLVPSGEPEEIATSYEVGGTVRGELTTELVSEMAEFSMTVNGQEIPEEYLEAMGDEFPGQTMSTNSTWDDEVLEVEDGLPIRVRRTYETCQRTKAEGDEESDETAVLEGRPFVIVADGEGGSLAEMDDDDEVPDEAYLVNHSLRFKTDYVLPVDEVEVEDSWSLSEEALQEIFELADGPELFEDDDPEEDDGEFDERMAEEAELSGTATFEAIEDVDGERCAVIVYECEMDVELDDLPASFLGMESDDGVEESAMELSMTFEGRLLFSLDHGRPLSLESEGYGTMRMSFTTVEEQNGQELTLGFDMGMDLRMELSETNTY